MNRRLGFTILELLTVIAIIGILSAITFPVYARAKDSAYRNADMSRMNTLRSALQLYRVDQGGYPPALLGYVDLYNDAGAYVPGNIVPADELKSFLYPKRVDSLKTFQPAYNDFTAAEITTAVWPNQDPRAIGSGAVLDLNGDGVVDGLDDYPNARQAYGPGDGMVAAGGVTNDPNVALKFYKMSGYDVGEVPDGSGGKRFELRYTLYWSSWGLAGGNGNDDPRQLGYTDPPENTVVTWNTYYRDYGNGSTPQGGKRDLVLFLGGSARTYDTIGLFERSWRVKQ
jgi:prepilin-type N-terminal cleavage/methylation domain-containing protein